ncbi:prepilin-type N-terminal cleavage/methylation domain-containing protein [Candidatus Parcubacteria bacterium]|nr:prepilin-type N-terminal cleavage/methylation domain-containing protein [Candidatus Parcubacteria bacterium]
MSKNYFTIAKKGFSLIEMIIYVSILAVIFLLIVRTVLSFTGSYRDLIVLRALDRSAYNSFERMSRDIHGASSINTLQSSLGTSPGALALAAGAATSTRFYVQNEKISVDVNGVYVGPLTVKNTAVSSLIFRMISGTTTAVRIDLTLTASSGPVIRTKTFHSTVLLEGS